MRNKSAYWDTSALVPLCCYQDASSALRILARRFSRMTVWWGTRVKVRSALARLLREGDVSESAFREAGDRLRLLSQSWAELLPTESVRERAEDLLDRCNLSAADALQLAAALTWCQGRPQRRTFVCLDHRLGEAASVAGFDVVGIS